MEKDNKFFQRNDEKSSSNAIVNEVNKHFKKENNEKKEHQNTDIGINFADMAPVKAAMALEKLVEDDYKFVIPIGFPETGKTLLLSSLFYAAKNQHPDYMISKKPESDPDNNYVKATEKVFIQGDQRRISMIEHLDKAKDEPGRKMINQNIGGDFDLIGFNMRPRGNKVSQDINLAFIDLAGEDLKEIKTTSTSSSNVTNKIKHAFSAIENAKVIFCLITPYIPGKEGDSGENDLHNEFIGFIKGFPELYENSKFVIIVSKWDQNRNENEDVFNFLEKKRPALYALYDDDKKHAELHKEDRTVFISKYSVGDFRTAIDHDENKNEITINRLRRINKQDPIQLWTSIYRLFTDIRITTYITEGKNKIEKPLPGGCLRIFMFWKWFE